MPTVVRSNGLAPALPALHGAQAKQSVDRRPARASRLPLSVSDSSCHSAADSTPVLLRKAASLRLPSYLHARRSRNFRSAVLAGSLPFSKSGLSVSGLSRTRLRSSFG